MKLILLICFAFSGMNLCAQKSHFINNNTTPYLVLQGKDHGLFKATLVYGIKKGFSIGLGYGLWKETPSLQYSLNTGIQWRTGKAFLGNYRDGANLRDSRSKSQVVFSFSPLLTANFSKRDYVYQEIEPFYYGTPNAVYSKYKYSLTIGSTFTISPRGTYKNVSTLRNRSQQVAMLGINLKDFNFTLYDDYIPYLTSWLQLGDNWDRFFTGGGFVRYRFSNQFTFHLYSEVYTGINRANAFVKPDVISYKPGSRNWHRKNYANQDPGQEYFNSSWLIAKGTYTGPVFNNTNGELPSVDFFVGSSASWTMFSQKLVHSTIHYDDDNTLRLHYFMHRSNIPGNLEAGGNNLGRNFRSLFVGGGLQSNLIPR